MAAIPEEVGNGNSHPCPPRSIPTSYKRLTVGHSAGHASSLDPSFSLLCIKRHQQNKKATSKMEENICKSYLIINIQVI